MDKNYNTHIDELLAKWLAGEATEAEMHELEQWRDISEENHKYVSQFEKLWEHAEENATFSAETSEAWSKVQQSIKQNSGPVVKLSVVYRFAAAIAASIAIFIAGW